MAALFISDLHLGETTPELNRAFSRFLQQQAAAADQLFILGDLFDVWLGDDDETPFSLHIVQQLRALSDSGVQLFIVPGNRDFLIGPRFAAQTGAQILSDPCALELYGFEILLLHGDLLCTDDKSYQRFRKIIRNPLVSALLTRLPLRLRQGIARRLRKHLGATRQQKAAAIMDASETTVSRFFDRYQLQLMIHGHTHRPKHHDYGRRHRYVLGDWGESLSYICVDESGIRLKSELI